VHSPAEGLVEGLQHTLISSKTMQHQGSENDVPISPSCEVGQPFQRAARNGLERLGVGLPTDATDVEQGAVDVPEDEASSQGHELILAARDTYATARCTLAVRQPIRAILAAETLLAPPWTRRYTRGTRRTRRSRVPSSTSRAVSRTRVTPAMSRLAVAVGLDSERVRTRLAELLRSLADHSAVT
jgi:hypothetical protein